MLLVGLAGIITFALWLSFYAAKIPRGPDRRMWSSTVFGHRGCRFVTGVVENTMPAYRYAHDRGADGIEIDVRLCKSGELVVFHDAQTHLQCDGPSRSISDMSRGDVESLSFLLDESKAERPPVLKGVLEFCEQTKVKLLLEIKHYSLSDMSLVVDGIRRLDDEFPDLMRNRTTIISFNPFVLYAIRRVLPQLAVGPLYDDATVSGVASGSCDCVASPWVALLLPKLWDGAFALATEFLLSPLMGASVLCTRADLTSEAQATRQLINGRAVYIYGLGNEFPSHLHNHCVFGSCDDHHDLLKKSVLKGRK